MIESDAFSNRGVFNTPEFVITNKCSLDSYRFSLPSALEYTIDGEYPVLEFPPFKHGQAACEVTQYGLVYEGSEEPSPNFEYLSQDSDTVAFILGDEARKGKVATYEQIRIRLTATGGEALTDAISFRTVCGPQTFESP